MGKGSREISGGPTLELNLEDEGSPHRESDLGRVRGHRSQDGVLCATGF